MRITKSLFVDFCKYPKLAWWKANNPDVYKKIRKIDSEEAEEHIIQIGQQVEDVIKQYLTLYHGSEVTDLMPRFHETSIHVETNQDDEDQDEDAIFTAPGFNLQQVLDNTLEAIREQKPILYQPTFVYKNCLVRADFMVWNGSSYDLIEAKAKSGIRKDITDDGEKKPIGAIEKEFINDVSFQSYVINHALSEHGLGRLGSIYIAYLNKEYTKIGPLSIVSLITKDIVGNIYDIEVIQRKKPTKLVIDNSILSDTTIEETIDKMQSYLVLSQEQADKVFLWGGLKYLEYFGEDKPFGTIMGMGIHHSNADTIQNLYYQGARDLEKLQADQIGEFNDNGQSFIQNYLKAKQLHSPIVDHQKIEEIFASFNYPICFYDYETISVPVPMLDHTRPYMQTIVQYSLHKYYENGSMKHYSGVYVGEGPYSKEIMQIDNNINAVEYECEQVIVGSYKDLLLQMKADIGEDLMTSTFIVRHEGFENSRNKEVAKLFPDLADTFLAINDRTYDLKKIVAEGYYFDPAYKGSASIKKVLPVLVPEMSYEGMDIGRGDIAMRALHNLITNTIPEDDRSQIIKNLLLYCGQDTLAMVRIFEALQALI